MCKSKINFILSIIVMFFLINISAFAQEEQSDKKSDSLKSNHQMMMHSKMNHNMMGMDSTKSKTMKDSTQHEGTHKHDMKMESMDMKKHENMQMNKEQIGEESIVREGEIDLQSIDKNKDGKIFQDMMDWNVISDEAGECPICGMKLKEISLEKAKENLLKNDFKVKEKTKEN